jgi:hypothetical protein
MILFLARREVLDFNRYFHHKPAHENLDDPDPTRDRSNPMSRRALMSRSI